MIEKITSPQNPRIKQAIRLHSSRGRQSQGKIIIFGEREVGRAFDTGLSLEELFVCEAVSDHEIDDIKVRYSSTVPVTLLSQQVFSKVSYGARTSGVVGIASRPVVALDDIKVVAPSLVVVVQSIEKPGNLGAIIRSADACGVSAVLHADPMTDFYHPNSIRASTGAVFGMSMASGTSQEMQHWLERHNFRVFTATLQGASDWFETNLIGDVAIVLGNEAKGLDHQWNREHYTAVKLPMKGQADSLNVSVTASVMMFEATRQRRTNKP